MPVLVYSLLRILLIVIAGVGLYLAGMGGFLLVVAAVLIGAALSYLLLEPYRRASAEWLQARGKGRTKVEDRLDSDAEAEDELLDEQEEHQHPAEAGPAESEPADPPDATTPSDGQGDGKADSDQ